MKLITIFCFILVVPHLLGASVAEGAVEAAGKGPTYSLSTGRFTIHIICPHPISLICALAVIFAHHAWSEYKSQNGRNAEREPQQSTPCGTPQQSTPQQSTQEVDTPCERGLVHRWSLKPTDADGRFLEGAAEVFSRMTQTEQSAFQCSYSFYFQGGYHVPTLSTEAKHRNIVVGNRDVKASIAWKLALDDYLHRATPVLQHDPPQMSPPRQPARRSRT